MANYFGITDPGQMRDNNEDTFLAEPLKGNPYIIACVIDGVGGYEGGEVAASIAREVLLQKLSGPLPEPIAVMQQALAAANEKIYAEKQQSRKNDQMACVLTMALVDMEKNTFFYAHIGDTRLYLLRDESLVKITKDQSFVGFLEDTGRLTEKDAMTHPKRNEINKALGFDAQLPLQNEHIETGESPFLPGDALLLCTDGLTDMIGSRDIAAVLSKKTTLEEKGTELVAAANKAGGKDNITVVLVQHAKAATPMKAATAVKKKGGPKKGIGIEKNVVAQTPVAEIPKKENRRGPAGLLGLLCLLLLAALGWSLWQLYGKKNEKALAVIPTTLAASPEQQSLQQAINNAASDTVLLTLFAKEGKLILSDTLLINRDTLHLAGNGIILQRDTALTEGAVALQLSPQCKYISLHNASFAGFDVAVLAADGQALHLKNIQFQNCRMPLVYQFAAEAVSGSFAIPAAVDSLPR